MKLFGEHLSLSEKELRIVKKLLNCQSDSEKKRLIKKKMVLWRDPGFWYFLIKHPKEKEQLIELLANNNLESCLGFKKYKWVFKDNKLLEYMITLRGKLYSIVEVFEYVDNKRYDELQNEYNGIYENIKSHIYERYVDCGEIDKIIQEGPLDVK